MMNDTRGIEATQNAVVLGQSGYENGPSVALSGQRNVRDDRVPRALPWADESSRLWRDAMALFAPLARCDGFLCAFDAMRWLSLRVWRDATALIQQVYRTLYIFREEEPIKPDV